MFKGNPTVIQGFEIPFDGRLFLTILGVHVLLGLTAAVAGIVAMLSKKQKGRHSRAGIVYYWAIWVVFITATVMALARWSDDYHLVILGGISFVSVLVARKGAKQKWKFWPIYHITGMGVSYIFLLIAFYMDNGKFLPVWKHIPPAFYWFLPAVIGFPILVYTLLHNPRSRNYFLKNK